MKKPMNIVDWFAYARQYDLLLAYNPYYREAFAQVVAAISEWDIAEDGQIADLGAGTGNYSVKAAQLHPHAKILHLEKNRGMNTLAAKKASGLHNFELVPACIEQAPFDEGSLQGILCINALYTFPEPYRILEQMYGWLQPGGRIVVLDPGRIMNIRAWRLAIAKYLLKTYGLRQTIRIFQQAKHVSQQNHHIRTQQLNGTYWTHTHEEFCAAIRQVGFQIDSSTYCFRGDCDLVFARK